MKEVLVSVWCITYNHKSYIRDALESFLMQETDFRYEIVVHDDASTDGTAEIVKEYEEKYPDLIHGIYQTENQTSKNGADRRWIWSIQSRYCKGKYIAFCEGDDYWLDIHKLQIQTAYMETNPECVLTVHDAVLVHGGKNETKAMHPYKYDSDISADEIIMQYHGILPTASMIFRKNALDVDFYGIFLKAGLGDYPLQLWMMTRGNIHYFSRIMSVYRYMHQGSWSIRVVSDFKSMAIHTVQMIRFLGDFDAYTSGRFQKSIARRTELFRRSMLLDFGRYASLESFEESCGRYDRETNGLYHREFIDIQELFSRIFQTKACELLTDIRRFHQKYQHIYVMGAGKFGALVAEQMRHISLDFEGFVISGPVEEGETYLQKPVRELKDISYALDETGIVIGISLRNSPDVIGNLKEAGIEHYLVSAVLKGFMEFV